LHFLDAAYFDFADCDRHRNREGDARVSSILIRRTVPPPKAITP